MRLLFPLLALASFAAASNTKPDWLSGQSAQYPKSNYIIGVGEGVTQDKAADRARAEIAKAFTLQVSETSSSSAQETSSGGTSTGSQSVSDDVKTSTRKVLDGVEVSSYWNDGQGSVYALAVLNRAHALEIITEKIADLDKSIPGVADELGKADGKFAKLKLALKLLRQAKSRRRLNADHRVLDPDGKGLPAPAGLDAALSQARQAVAAVTFSVSTDGVSADQTTSRIVDGLSAYGLKVVEKSDNPADVVVSARSSAQRLEPEDITWFWAKGSILVKMSYGSTGEVFTRFEESGEEASRDPSTSVDAALTVLADRAADHVFKVINSNDILDE